MGDTDPCEDPAHAIVTTVMAALRSAYSTASSCPVDGAVDAPTVRFFVSEGTPLAAWDAFLANGSADCTQPFLWVRLSSRFRSSDFPSAELNPGNCTGVRVVELEVGVGRCLNLGVQTDWDTLAREASRGMDDSFRIERVLNRCAAVFHTEGKLAATDTLVPYGPDGGISAWSGGLFVGF